MVVTLAAYAKINRDLRIVGRDAEGYHLISTIFETIALHDSITVGACAGPLQVTCSDRQLPTDERNIVTRAVHGWCDLHRGGRAGGLSVHIEKRVPLQAGLGGGSSDAAATIVALTMLHHGLTARIDGRDALAPADRALAARLGADVAFFLVGGRALGTGRGERLRPLDDVAPVPVVLAQPELGVATADAYRWFSEAAGLRPGTSLERATVPWHPHTSACTNDLQAAVAARHPAIATLVTTLHGCGARQAAMSGSGSVVFGAFDRARGAALGESALRQMGVRWWRTTTLTRAAYWGP